VPAEGRGWKVEKGSCPSGQWTHTDRHGMTRARSASQFLQNRRRLPAEDSREKVTRFLGDRLVDQRTGQPFHKTSRFIVGPGGTRFKDYSRVRLVPGMPADVRIGHGTRHRYGYFPRGRPRDVIEKKRHERAVSF